MAHLSGFVGVLQVDGYSGYRAIAAGNSVSLAFCWSHVRRRFYELAAAGLRLLPAKRSGAPLNSTGSKTTSAVEPTRSAALCGRERADRSPIALHHG
jgi:transposase